MSSQEPSRPTTLSARILKWVGATTAVLSLLFAARQLTTWIGDAMERRREAAAAVELARQQASRAAFAEAWTSLDRAETLRPGDAVDAARIDIAFAWLQAARTTPGLSFSALTDRVLPTLDRALVPASGSRRADLLAHVGWAAFLRSRDGYPGDPEARYREALAADPSNAYAHAMLAHWLMWTGAPLDVARKHFDQALASAEGRRPFVRRMQLSALSNRGETADLEMIRVADDMRQRGEALDRDLADRVLRVLNLRYQPQKPSPAIVPAEISPADLAATYEWVAKIANRPSS